MVDEMVWKTAPCSFYQADIRRKEKRKEKRNTCQIIRAQFGAAFQPKKKKKKRTIYELSEINRKKRTDTNLTAL